MKILTLLIYTLLITCIMSCGHPQKKRKMDWKKHKIEKNDSIKRHHPDSLVNIRDKRLARRKHKNDTTT